MIADFETNFLYLADTLPTKYPNFYERFKSLLNENKIEFELLPNTKDVWAVDFMPVQIEENKFVRFTYNPPYLQSKKYLKTISNTDEICKALNIETIKSEIIIDGGNVTKYTDKVIMTDRIFRDNPNIERKNLIKQLEQLFQIDKIVLVPEQPFDFTGHSDGMVRFIDNHNVIINDYSKEKPEFSRAFEIALHNAGLNYEKIPYNVYENPSNDYANGDYINYLQMENIIIVPTFNFKEDELAVRQLEQIFYSKKVVTIEGNEIANDGGIINCITWNIKR
jgi:agmatine deiminase